MYDVADGINDKDQLEWDANFGVCGCEKQRN